VTTWNPRANNLFLKALELRSADERRQYLHDACAGDTALRAEVEALLVASANAGDFLEGVPYRQLSYATGPAPLRRSVCAPTSVLCNGLPTTDSDDEMRV
jgi:hypothetical protein